MFRLFPDSHFPVYFPARCSETGHEQRRSRAAPVPLPQCRFFFWNHGFPRLGKLLLPLLSPCVFVSVQELGAPQTKSPSRSWKSRHFGCTFSSAVILSSPELYSKGCMEPCAAFCRRAAAPRETGSSLNSSQGGAAPGTCSLPPPLGWLPGPCQHPTCAAKGSWQPGAAPTCKTKGLVSNRLPCPQVCGLSQRH